MGKTRRGHKEYSREQQLFKENRELKKIISSLRKRIARNEIDSERVKEIIEEHYEQETTQEEAHKTIEKLKKRWTCHTCVEGLLEIILYQKMGVTHYYRQCNSCPNRTRSKAYTDTVDGLHKKKEEKT